jgi:membrane protein implicated in regulation of membrane protease activity
MGLLWWYWVALGLVLVVLELAAPGGFYFIFFGILPANVADIAGMVATAMRVFSQAK